MMKCETCKGKGIDVPMAIAGQPCPDCGGKGYLIPDELVDLAADEWRDRTNSVGANLAAARYTLAAVFDWLGFGDAETIEWCTEHKSGELRGHCEVERCLASKLWDKPQSCRIGGRLLLPPRGES